MRRLFIIIAGTLAFGLVGCRGGDPAAPHAPAFSGNVNATVQACTGQAQIRRLIAAIFAPGGVDEAQQAFTNINRLYCDRGGLADGQAAMFDLVDVVVKQLVGRELRPTPRGGDGGAVPSTTPAATTELIQRLFAYVGLGDSLNLPPDALARAAHDGGAKVARPGQTDTIIAISKDFATVWPGSFFTARALVVVARQPDATPFQTTYTEYPPRYRIYVSPKTAMTNYGVGGVLPAGAPAARVEVCPGDLAEGVPHPPVETLRILRVKDVDDPRARATELLPRAAATLVSCESYADAPLGGYALAGTRRGALLALLSKVGGAIVEAVGPRTLYAWDLGVGGFAPEYSGFVPVRGTTSGVSRVTISVDSATVTQTAANPFTAPVGVPFKLTAIPSFADSSTTPVPGVACAWAAASGDAPVAIDFTPVNANPNVVTFTPTRALAGGSYTISATCRDAVGVRQMVVPAVVPGPH